MRQGTRHFKSRDSAILYYKNYGIGIRDLQTAIADGSIVIGPPKVNQNQRLVLVDGRYFIEEIESISKMRCTTCGRERKIKSQGKCSFCWAKFYKPSKKERGGHQPSQSPESLARSLLKTDGYCVLIQKFGEWKSLYSGPEFLNAGRLYDEIECTRTLYKLKNGKLTIIQNQYVNEEDFLHNAALKEIECRTLPKN